MMILRAQSNSPQRSFMYNLLLIVSMLAVVLSPLLLDLFLSIQEQSSTPRPARDAKKKGPAYAWASSRIR